MRFQSTNQRIEERLENPNEYLRNEESSGFRSDHLKRLCETFTENFGYPSTEQRENVATEFEMREDIIQKWVVNKRRLFNEKSELYLASFDSFQTNELLTNFNKLGSKAIIQKKLQIN